jgi:hypothetical protein
MDNLDLKAIIAFVQKNWTAVTAAAVVLVTLILMKRRKKATLKPEVKANVIDAATSGNLELLKAHVNDSWQTRAAFFRPTASTTVSFLRSRCLSRCPCSSVHFF